jgi:hypothetical protein
MGRLLAYRMLLGAAAKMAVSFPDIQRYFRMRKM